MTKVLAMPDTEGAIQTWLRAKTGITAVVGERVFFGIPNEPAFPLITARLIGGGRLPGDAFLVQSLIQFDCWADGRKKRLASEAMTALCDVLEQGAEGEYMDDEHTLFGASFSSAIFLPDPSTDQARYIVTASITAKRTRNI